MDLATRLQVICLTANSRRPPLARLAFPTFGWKTRLTLRASRPHASQAVGLLHVLCSGVCWTKSEPTLSKIQRILRIESRPAFPPASASLRRAKQKNFLYIFLIARPQNFFQLRKRKFFCFAFLLTQELRKRPPPIVRLRRAGKRAKIHFPHTPFSFCPLAFGLRPIFSAEIYKKGGGWV